MQLMPYPLGLQLYTLREQLANDFEGVIEQVAEMGYVGVELAGLPEGVSVQQAVNCFDRLGLAIIAAHTPLPIGPQGDTILEQVTQLGTTRLVSGRGPESYKTLDDAKTTIADFNAAAANCAKHGLTFHLHNHWWEFDQVEGEPIYDLLLEGLEENVFFEIDTYWTVVGGADPVKVIDTLGSRVELLHIKDGPADATRPQQPMVAVGQGVMAWEPIVRAAKHAEWLIVELDACETDMLQAVRDSIAYLSDNNLARKATR
jgi:sugar phosphate isomerase/epimerase